MSVLMITSTTVMKTPAVRTLMEVTDVFVIKASEEMVSLAFVSKKISNSRHRTEVFFKIVTEIVVTTLHILMSKE